MVLNGRDGFEKCAVQRRRRRVVTASLDRTAQIWNAETGAMIEVLSGHLNQVVSARFSPDGRYVATMAYDNTVRLWDSATGTEMAVFDGLRPGDSIISNISPIFSPDGRFVAAAGPDDEVRRRRLYPTTQALVGATKKSLPRCLTRDERGPAFLDPEPPAWCIELNKWPYATRGRRDWLARKKAGRNPQMPKEADAQ